MKMKTRFFYRLARFDNPTQQKYINHTRDVLDGYMKAIKNDDGKFAKVCGDLMISSNSILDKLIPDEFNHFDHDIRTWILSFTFKEMSEDGYDRTVELEKELIGDLKCRNDIILSGFKAKNTITTPSLLKTDGWHFPVEVLDNGDIESQIKEIFNIEGDVILEVLER